MNNNRIRIITTDGIEHGFKSSSFTVERDREGYLVTNIDTRNWFFFPFANILFAQCYDEIEESEEQA